MVHRNKTEPEKQRQTTDQDTGAGPHVWLVLPMHQTQPPQEGHTLTNDRHMQAYDRIGLRRGFQFVRLQTPRSFGPTIQPPCNLREATQIVIHRLGNDY